MNRLRHLALGAAAAAFLAAPVHASVVLNFDNPALFVFSPDFSTQSLTEGEYSLKGPTFSFQPRTARFSIPPRSASAVSASSRSEP